MQPGNEKKNQPKLSPTKVFGTQYYRILLIVLNGVVGLILPYSNLPFGAWSALLGGHNMRPLSFSEIKLFYFGSHWLVCLGA